MSSDPADIRTINFDRRGSASLDGAAVADSPASRKAAIESARSLHVALRNRAPEAEATGTIPEDTVQDFHKHGLFRLLQPARVGGFEFHPSIYIDVCTEIARGCASSAWVLVNLVSHHQFMALWEPQAQQDVWDGVPHTLVGSSYIFSAGHAEPVQGGYRISGRWPFSSGIDPCQWVVLGASTTMTGDASKRENRYFLLPRADYEIMDTWHVMGLRGTGSKDVACRDIFVPAHRSLSFAEMAAGTSPGLALNRGALFRLPMHITGGYTLISVLLGAARGAVDDYVAMVRDRSSAVSGKGLADLTAVQTRIAEADACLDTVELIAREAYRSAMDALDRQPLLDPAKAVAHRRNSAYCAQLCVRAIDLVFAGAGGAGLYETNPIQRAWRDVHAGAAQFGLQWDVAAPAAGRQRLGLPIGLPGIAEK